jgi:hypothetical protein
VGFAVAALAKHPCALPFVNCARIVAAVLDQTSMVLGITEAALLPFYLRTGRKELYAKELGLWKPSVAEEFKALPKELLTMSQYMHRRFEGRHCVVKAPFGDVRQIQKMCTVCSAYSAEAKFCVRCKKVYYCGRECQKADWSEHKAVCVKKSPMSP